MIAATELLRDMDYLETEGFIDTDEDGRCYFKEEACQNTL